MFVSVLSSPSWSPGNATGESESGRRERAGGGGGGGQGGGERSETGREREAGCVGEGLRGVEQEQEAEGGSGRERSDAVLPVVSGIGKPRPSLTTPVHFSSLTP